MGGGGAPPPFLILQVYNILDIHSVWSANSLDSASAVFLSNKNACYEKKR